MQAVQDIEMAVAGILARILPGKRVAAEIGMAEDLKRMGMDSLALLRVISEIESAFGIKVEDDDLEDSNFATLSALSGYLRSKVSMRGRG